MAVFLFIISVYAALLGPVAAIGGVMTAILWTSKRPSFAVVALSISLVALGFRSSAAHPEEALSAHLHFMASHLCAMALWGVFASLLWKLVPEETPTGRRQWLQRRVRL